MESGQLLIAEIGRLSYSFLLSLSIKSILLAQNLNSGLYKRKSERYNFV
jgi:hypothetical protein